MEKAGRFQRTHALRGELNALLDIDVAYLDDGNPVVVDIDGCLVPFYADSVRPKGSESYLIRLEGVDCVEEAAKFVNKDIFVLKDILREYQDADMVFFSDLVGFTVEDVDMGTLGKVVSVDDSTANVLLYVKSPDGDEIIVPAPDDLIVEIDTENKIIRMNLPEGLF